MLLNLPPVQSRSLKKISLVLLLLSAIAQAETIRLKNGRTIAADSVREVNGRVEYTIGENTFAISKSSVERIDTGGTPIVTNKEEVPEPATAKALAGISADDLSGRVVQGGKVSSEALNAIEAEGNAARSAVAYFVAARQERSVGSVDRAVQHLMRARAFLPENEIILVHLASALMQTGRLAEATTIAEEAVRRAPTFGEAYGLLGFALLQGGKAKEAIRALKKAMELDPDAKVKTLLERAERELKAESEFASESSSHFQLRFEGGNVPLAFRKQLLQVLESHFNDLVRDLDHAPRESISVVLYTDRQFFDVTNAPSWTGALNDGRIRVPISGKNSVDAELSRVLKHELAHSFIGQITRGRCPTWLNEGVAQLLEPGSIGSNGRRLSALYAANRAIPLNQLESSFIRFQEAEAAVAYAESLAAVEYIRETYGMSDISMTLKRIGQGQSTEAALRATIRSGYSQLESELAEFLRRTYGQ